MRGAADIPGQEGVDYGPDQAAAGSPGRLQERLDQLPDGHPSSPRDEDGSWRAPAISLKDLELPIDDAPSETGTPLGTPDQPPPSDATSDAWRAVVPEFQAAWQSHLEQWPETDRSPEGGFDEQTGLWRSEAGHPLTKEQLTDTDNVLKQVKEVESNVTSMMKVVEATVPGVTLVGLDNRLKGEDRFKEKVAYEIAREPDQPVSDIIDRIPDKVRYTCQLSPERYTEGYSEFCAQLADKGNDLLLCRNAWKEQEYKGVNTRWIGPERQVFEVQFHTPDSFAAKQLTHPAYERIRTRSEPGAESRQLEEFQKDVTAKVEIPYKAEIIPDYRREGY